MTTPRYVNDRLLDALERSVRTEMLVGGDRIEVTINDEGGVYPTTVVYYVVREGDTHRDIVTGLVLRWYMQQTPLIIQEEP